MQTDFTKANASMNAYQIDNCAGTDRGFSEFNETFREDSEEKYSKPNKDLEVVFGGQSVDPYKFRVLGVKPQTKQKQQLPEKQLVLEEVEFDDIKVKVKEIKEIKDETREGQEQESFVLSLGSSQQIPTIIILDKILQKLEKKPHELFKTNVCCGQGTIIGCMLGWGVDLSKQLEILLRVSQNYSQLSQKSRSKKSSCFCFEVQPPRTNKQIQASQWCLSRQQQFVSGLQNVQGVKFYDDFIEDSLFEFQTCYYLEQGLTQRASKEDRVRFARILKGVFGQKSPSNVSLGPIQNKKSVLFEPLFEPSKDPSKSLIVLEKGEKGEKGENWIKFQIGEKNWNDPILRTYIDAWFESNWSKIKVFFNL